MKLRRLRGFWVMSLLFFSLILGSCSDQQQDQESLDYDQQEGANQEEDQQYQQQGEGEGEENYQGDDMDQGNFQGVDEGGENNMLENAANGEGENLDSPDNDLADIIDEMNQQAPAQESSDAYSNADSAGEAAGGGGGASSGSGGVVTGIAGLSAGPGLPELGSKLSYMVVKNDTLGKISSKIFGTPARWRHLAKFSGLEDPNKIYPGDIIYYQLNEQSLAFATNYENLSKDELTVREGDTLGKLALRVYGNSKHWKYIWRQNGQITDPDDLVAGSKLVLVPENGLGFSDSIGGQAVETIVQSERPEDGDQHQDPKESLVEVSRLEIDDFDWISLDKWDV